MEEGSLRCDCNVSLREIGDNGLNARCEVKNINSARFAKKAVEYEIERQLKIYENGQKVTQDTREFVPELGITKSLRGKEDAHDYRYFPEPDLPLLTIHQKRIIDIQQNLPPLPVECYRKFRTKFLLDHADALALTESTDVVGYFEKLVQIDRSLSPKTLAKLFINRCKPYLDEHQLSPFDFPLSQEQIISFVRILKDGKIVKSTAYQQVWPQLLAKPQNIEKLIQSMGLGIETDDETLRDLVTEVINAHPEQAEKFRKGKKALMGFFIGQVMRKTNGKANPEIVKKELTSALI